MRTRRITADIDTRNKFIVVRFFLRAFFKLNAREITIKRSSRKGYHLIAWLNKNGKRKALRQYLGDDKKRIYWDSKRKIGRQTLFKSKKWVKI